MPTAHGQYGHYPALRRRRTIIVVFVLAMACMAVSGCVIGVGLRGTVLPAPTGWWSFLYTFGGSLLILAIGGSVIRWMSRNEQQFFTSSRSTTSCRI